MALFCFVKLIVVVFVCIPVIHAPYPPVTMSKYSALPYATIDECRMLVGQENSSTWVPQQDPTAVCGPHVVQDSCD